MLPDTDRRVRLHTASAINRRIRRQAERSVAYFAHHPDEIEQRLEELDQEWDIERTLQANAATLGFVGAVLGAGVGRRWLVLPALVTGFLFQHATQGWCPPLPLLRRLGFRTAGEIAEERYALKALRGDFENIPTDGFGSRSARASDALSAAKG